MAVPKKVTKIQEIEAHSSAVTCVALGQLNGRVLATGGADCLVNLWVLGQKTPLKSLAGLSSAAECIKFDPTEESVVAGSSQGALKVREYFLLIFDSKVKWSINACKLVGFSCGSGTERPLT
jgi:WD40 repeat protein